VFVALMVIGAMAMEHSNWVEPTYAEDTASTAFLEDGTSTATRSKGMVRGVSHTVGPRKGMVTYISPARHIQTGGIVLNPAPIISMSTVERPQPQVIVQQIPVEVQVPVAVPTAVQYVEHVETHPIHHHHSRVHPIFRRSHVDRHVHMLTPTGVATRVDAITPMGTISPIPFGTVSKGARGVPLRVSGAGIHTYSPEVVPASLRGEPYHARNSYSKGPILVPHGPAGAIAVEGADYAGYNPGPRYKYNSIPSGFYSDGTPYAASIDQRYN